MSYSPFFKLFKKKRVTVMVETEIVVVVATMVAAAVVETVVAAVVVTEIVVVEMVVVEAATMASVAATVKSWCASRWLQRRVCVNNTLVENEFCKQTSNYPCPRALPKKNILQNE